MLKGGVNMIAPKLRFKADDGNDFPELEAKSLFDICEYRNKQSVGKNYVGTENMKQNFSGLESLDEETEMKGVCYCKGDTLMSNIRPYLRKTWKADREGVCSTDVLVFHPIDVASEYLHYLIASDKFISYVMTGAKGVKMPRGDKEHMMKFSIMVPSLPEQQKIADFLSTIDTIIEKQRAMVSAWEERKKGVMQKLFSQEVRFKADDGSDFPDWEEKKLGDIGTVKMCKRVLKEQTSESGDVPFYKIGTFGGIPDAFISRELYEELKTKYSFPRKGNILLSAAGTIGRTVIYDGEDAFFQDSNIVWLDNDSSVLDKFLLQFYNQTSWDNIEGGTIKRLYNGLFLSKIIPLPSLPEQQKIADCLSALDAVIEKQKETLEKWQELKKGLLQQMFV